MGELPPSDRVAGTPIFDELYDCALQLGMCEVVLEHIPYERRRPGLAVVVRRTDDDRVIHRAVVRSSVEEAATRIRASLMQEASETEESE